MYTAKTKWKIVNFLINNFGNFSDLHFGLVLEIYEQLAVPANIYLFKFNNRNTANSSEICTRIYVRHRRRSGVFIVDSGTYFTTTFSRVSTVEIELVNVCYTRNSLKLIAKITAYCPEN